MTSSIALMVSAMAGRLLGALLILSVVLLVWPDAAEALVLDRNALESGQVWRAFSGHWVHWSTAHWFWDTFVFAALSSVAIRRWPSRWAFCLALSSIAVAFGVYLLEPALLQYAGLSGLCSAVYVMCLVSAWKDARTRFARLVLVLALLGLLAKIGYEWLTQLTIFVPSARLPWRAVPSAHLIGGLCGWVSALYGGGSKPH